ncbi:type IVB secretion system protein IcmH/DotU [Acidisoma sp. C75]
MSRPPTAQPLDDDPTIIWRPDPVSNAAPQAELGEDVGRVLPSVLGDAPITQAAMPLLASILAFRRLNATPDISVLRHNMIAAIRAFEQQAAEKQAKTDDIVAARYLLCCALDETIATAAAVGEKDWSKMSLLVSFHNESWGGDKAFILIDRLRQDPERYADLLQLALFILSLGFEGRYHVINNGRLQLEELRSDIARQIERPRSLRNQARHLSARPVTAQAQSAFYVPPWVSFTIAGVLIVISVGLWSATLDQRANSSILLMEEIQRTFPLKADQGPQPDAASVPVVPGAPQSPDVAP